MFEDFDLDDFWEDSDYAREKYVEVSVTPEIIGAVERELGFRLPASYVALMSGQNGGIPKRTCFPTTTPTSWADDHIAITGFLGIGSEKTFSLLGRLGSRFMQEEWGYPRFGICICDCPSGGHDMVMLDYRDCGPNGEPAVVHVDQELDFRVTFLARDFETFARGLVPESDYDTSEDDLAAALIDIRSGSFSTALTRLIAASSAPKETEAALRRLLEAIATEKGYFALHADPSSHLVYDVLFDLLTTTRTVETPEAFLSAYPDLLAFGDGEVSTRGYAPQVLGDWMKARLAAREITEHEGRLVLSAAYQQAVKGRLAAFSG